MLQFILRRLGLVIPTFIGITLLTFAFVHMIPGDPVMIMAGERGISPERHAQLLAELGLDKPMWQQYLHYIWGVMHGDLGISLKSRLPVWEEFVPRFWFAMIKVTTIIVMIVIGVGVIFFGFGNGGQAIGFGNLTEHGGFFAGGWKGFLTALCIVVASYQGVELIGITAGEAKNPQVTLRSAVGKVLWRILIFYVGAIFVIVTIFPWNEIGSNGSPFVLTFAKIGITAAAGIINFVVLTAALSGCNSGMYSCGRMLYALAKNRQLPAVVGKVSRHGVPVAGVAISIAILLIGSCLNYIIPNPQRVFVYVYSASVLPGMVPWFVILISQLRFRQAHKAAIASHPFRSILFPWANYLTMAFLICVLIGMYFNEDTRMSLFVGMGFLLAVTLIYKVFGLNRHGTAHKLRE